MEDRFESRESLCLAIRYWTTHIVEYFLGHVFSKMDNILYEFQIQLKRPKARANHMVAQTKPPIVWIKLNVDGSCEAICAHVVQEGFYMMQMVFYGLHS